MNDIESLKIYKEYMELIRYSYVVIDKVKNEEQIF